MLARGLSLTAKIFLAGILLVGCSSDERDDPGATPPEDSGIMGKEKFVEVLADVYLVEAAYKTHAFKNDDEKAILLENYSDVFSSHGITPEEFENTHKWWWQHPAAMNGVVTEVTERLNSIEKTTHEEAAKEAK